MSDPVTDSKTGTGPDAEVEKAYSQHENVYDLDEKAKIADFKADAIEAENTEHNMGVLEAVRAYPMASFWAFVMSCTIVSCISDSHSIPVKIENLTLTMTIQIMESYDVFLMGNFVALPKFKEDFGVPHGDGWVIETKWQSALQVSGQVRSFHYDALTLLPGSSAELRPSGTTVVKSVRLISAYSWAP
tara:strand:+ start:1187 stop:1750 length:564 start_codon:yes stop_codon:yes gene_type:complete